MPPRFHLCKNFEKFTFFLYKKKWRLFWSAIKYSLRKFNYIENVIKDATVQF